MGETLKNTSFCLLDIFKEHGHNKSIGNIMGLF